MTRRTRQIGTLVLTAAAIAYLVWKIELQTTLDVLADTNLAWFALAVTIMVVTVPVLALRWGWLLAAHDIHERVPWLTRAYFVAYTAGQVLPTSLGGDAVRVVETTRRHPGRATVVTGTVLLERGFGGAATVVLGAIGFLLSIGEFDVSAYLWLEGVFVFGTLVLGFLFFARSARPLLRRTRPALRRLPRWRSRCVTSTKASTTTAAVPVCSGRCFAVTFAVQTVRILSIWAAAKAVGHRSRSAHLLRLRAAALPRDARAVHAERPCRARGVLRQLPRKRRRRCEPGVRRRLSLLPRHAACWRSPAP